MSLNNRRDPARNAVAITPSDSTVLTETRALYIGTAGDLNLLFADDSAAVVLPAHPAGLFAYAVKKVMSTSTTASGIVGLS